MNKFVVTIGRELGSGGREIGKRLAKKLNVEFYDKDIIKIAAKDTGIDKNIFEMNDEKQKGGTFWYTLAMASHSYMDISSLEEIPTVEKLFWAQAKTIEDLANKSSCVIVGRCSNYILRSKKNAINIFLYSNLDTRIKNIEKRFEMSEKEAKRLVARTDKDRESYYNYYTNEKWGDKDSFDLCIDTGKLGIDETVDLIIEYLKIKSFI